MAMNMKTWILMVLLQVVYFSTQASASSCKDETPSCSKYVAQGYCVSSHKYYGLMKQVCCASCSVCDNKHTQCDNFAAKGYCKKRYIGWMSKNCCKSCKEVEKAKSTGSSKSTGSALVKSTLDKDACVKSINYYRGLHVNTPALKWDPVLASKAQAYANYLKQLSLKAGRVIMKHDPRNQAEKTGENLFYRDNRQIGECKDADKAWYSEIKDWSFSQAKSTGGATGHFTQMVWVGTTRFGVGRVTFDSPKYAKYGNKVTIIVAKYQAPGNFHYRGQRYEFYSKNVQPEKSK